MWSVVNRKSYKINVKGSAHQCVQSDVEKLQNGHNSIMLFCYNAVYKNYLFNMQSGHTNYY